MNSWHKSSPIGRQVQLLAKVFVGVFFSAAVMVLLVAPAAVADNVYATVRGSITDASGAAVSGVQLTATNTTTGASYSTVSQSNGIYEFLQLPIGSYTLSATKTGFKTFKSTAITLVVNQVYNLPIAFELGSVSETVEVNSESVQVETTSIQLQTLISAKQIVDLPLNGRNFTQLEQLVPGVQASSDRFGTFSVNGSQSNQSSYLINGADSNDIPLNTALVLPSPDAIQEFNLISSTINPEYGRNSGGIVNALIKSGSNQFHGSAFEFYRDTFLNTHNFFSQVVPAFHRNQFGGTVGGPILKSKTFFFLSYQGTRTRSGVPQVVSVFSPAQVGGDFSGDLATIVNNGFGASTPFPLVGDDGVLHPAKTPFFGTGTTGAILNCGNAITAATPTCSNAKFGKLPTSDFNSVAANLTQRFVPLPNTAGNQFAFNANTVSAQDQGIARVDHTFNSANSVWATLFFNHAPSLPDLPFTGSTLPGFGEIDLADSKQFTLAYNHTFNSNTLNEVRVSYSRLAFASVEPANPQQPSAFGFTGINSQNTAGASAPFIGVTGLFSLGFSTNGPQPRKDQTYQFTDNFSKVVGRHTLKFGFDARRFQVDNPFSAVNNGSFSFGGTGNFSSGDPGLDFLLGIPDSFSQNAGGIINARAYEYYGYAQDTWQVKTNLTLTYGAGYQVDTPYKNGQFGGIGFNCFLIGEQSKIFPAAPTDLVFPGDTGCNNSGATTHYGHIGPRVGFAYSPNWGWISGGAGKLSIRGGYGIYYNRAEEEGALQNLGAPPFGVNSNGATNFGGNPSFAAPFTDISTGQVFPNAFPFTSFPKAGDPTDFFSPLEPFSINVINSKFNVPYSQNFNLNVQRELPGSMILSVSYVGALGRHLYRSFEGNPITAAGQAACAADPTCANGNGRVFQHFFFPTHSLAPGNIFGSVGEQATDGTSNYNSLQVGLNKSVSHGLLFIASYTYSHAIDNGSGLENSGFGARGINLIDPQLNIGDSGFDARQRFVFSAVYEIPSLTRLMAKAPDKIFGGWKVAAISTLQGGFPVNFSDSGFTSLSCDALTFFACADNPSQVVSSVQKLNPRSSTFKNKRDFFFNPADFARAAVGTFGNTGRDSLHGPGSINTDFSLFKDTKLTESKTVELRIEAYNLFNHTNFGQPNVNIASSNFGRITSAAGGRLFQLGAKFYF